MRRKLYVLFDRVAEESGPVFEAKNDGIARRMMEHTLRESEYPEDHRLICVGEIDHETQKIDVPEAAREVYVSVTDQYEGVEEEME